MLIDEEKLKEFVRAVVSEELAAREATARAERTYSEDEFCALAGISRTTAWQLRRAGKLKFFRPSSRRIRYTQAHLDEFISDCQAGDKATAKKPKG